MRNHRQTGVRQEKVRPNWQADTKFIMQVASPSQDIKQRTTEMNWQGMNGTGLNTAREKVETWTMFITCKMKNNDCLPSTAHSSSQIALFA